MKRKQQNFFVNPFSDDFLKTWELWNAYKLESFNFQYKGVISEQMAIKHLVDLSGGDEQKAIKIIEQSIRRQWQGFFPLNETTNGKSRSTSKNNGQSAEEARTKYRSEVQAELNKRNGEGKQDGNESSLKAV